MSKRRCWICEELSGCMIVLEYISTVCSYTGGNCCLARQHDNTKTVKMKFPFLYRLRREEEKNVSPLVIAHILIIPITFV